MKRLALLLTFLLVSATDARADLGAADIQGEELSVEDQDFDAWCGSSGNKCKVNFKNGVLSVDRAGGIMDPSASLPLQRLRRLALVAMCVGLALTHVILGLVTRARVGKAMRLRAILNHIFGCEGHETLKS